MITNTFVYPASASKRGSWHWIAVAVVALGCSVSALAQAPQGDAASGADKHPKMTQRAFKTPEAASRALIEALESDDSRAIYAVLGRGSGRLMRSGDPVQDQGMRRAIVAAYQTRVQYDLTGDSKATMLLGEKDYPFPYPIVKGDAGWTFDAKGGAEEIINRRIGKNEIAAINVCLAYVDAQREYALLDRNKNGLLEYAQRMVSTPGKHDGLYWPTQEGDPPSPFGPLAARTRTKGYLNSEDEPYYGYYYKILTAQGKDAAGGAYDYIVNSKMIGGFALVAYPARWGASGVMTFVCNHDGVVYQKNLGRDTVAVAAKMAVYNPDDTWSKVPQP